MSRKVDETNTRIERNDLSVCIARSCHPAIVAMMPSSVSSHAYLLAPIPLTMAMKPGQLQLARGRLTFTSGHDVLLDAPVGELHSPAIAVMGLHVWHGTKRYRFALGRRDARAVTPKADGTAMRTPDHLDDAAGPAVVAQAWMDALGPLVGTAPAGLRVRAPWPRWAWMLGVIGLSLFFVAAVVVLVALKN